MTHGERKIPATMATQHPDHANIPYWKRNGDPFINAQEEVEELITAFQDLRCQEYMWDWEGKYVDEAVVDRLYSTYIDFFKKHPLGEDVFLTFRLPNIWLEKGFRLARAYMGILTFEDLSRDLGFGTPPVFEVILPMTDEAKKILHLQKTFSQVAALKHATLGERRGGMDYLRVIPLIEGIAELTASRKILHEYLELHEKEYGRRPEYLRPFIARSDPPLNAGLVPAVIAAKIALSEYYRFSEESGVPVYPIIGVGTLPFRGGLSPNSVEDFLAEYSGVRTVTIQSAFRYDYPLKEVKRAIAQINHRLPEGKPRLYAPEEVQQGEQLSHIFSRYYQHTVEGLAGTINSFSKIIPHRRERMLHIGLFGYSRGMAGKRLPRAISFTSVLYSLGVPPELIGTGRGLREAEEKGLTPVLKTLYRNIEKDLIHAGQFLNKENLAFLSRKSNYWRGVQKDIEGIERFLGRELGPQTVEHYLHRNLVSSTYLLWQEGRIPEDRILEAAKIRHAVG
jgi:phosphoenolpyruvate carboxylase